MEILVRIQNNYGLETVYPECDKAITFTKMLGSKTLTHAALGHIEALGYKIVIKKQEYKTFKHLTQQGS